MTGPTEFKVKDFGPSLIGADYPNHGAKIIDLYAAAALQGIISNGALLNASELARQAFTIAVEMLAERQRLAQRFWPAPTDGH